MPQLTKKYRLFPTGQDLLPSEAYQLLDGSTAPLTTSPGIVLPNPPPQTGSRQFSFILWNINGRIVTTPSTVISNIETHDTTASAWYLETGPGSGPPTAYFYAYSPSRDEFLGETPVASVNGVSWSGDNAVQTGDDSKTIRAKQTIGTENFTRWYTIFGSATINNDQLTVAQSGGVWAIAEYAAPDDGRIYPPDIELIEATLERILRRNLAADPAPIDLFRAGRILERTARESQTVASDDALSSLLSGIGKMSRNELQVKQMEIHAAMNRLNAANSLVDEAIKKQGTKK